METLWFPLSLLLLTQLQPGDTHNLTCLSDFLHNITCVWNSTGVPPGTVCTLHGFHRNNPSECVLKPLDDHSPSLRQCHLYYDVYFTLFSSFKLEVRCEGWSTSVHKIEEYKPALHIKLSPPGMPTITDDSISWSWGNPFPERLKGYTFQLQYKPEKKRWEDQDVRHIFSVRYMQTQTLLPMEALTRCGSLVKGQRYQVRVRVNLRSEPEYYRADWSQWSPIATWRSEVGTDPPQPAGEGSWTKEISPLVIVCFAALLILLAVIYTLYPGTSWISKVTCKPVPDPSKPFDALISVHGGNFQKWLSPKFSAESFDIFNYSEDISPVEVCDVKDTDALFRKDSSTEPTPCDITGQSSSFSNIGYFCSRYPNEIETCSVYFSSQSAETTTEEGQSKNGHGSTNRSSIQTCSSYESLQKCIDRKGKPKYEDSGIGVGNDDQETAEEGEDEESPRETAICSLPSAVLPLPPPFGKSPFLAPFPPHLSNSPLFSFPVDFAFCRNLTSGKPGLDETLCQSFSGELEPCSDGYMPAKDTQSSPPDSKCNMKTQKHTELRASDGLIL